MSSPGYPPYFGSTPYTTSSGTSGPSNLNANANANAGARNGATDSPQPVLSADGASASNIMQMQATDAHSFEAMSPTEMPAYGNFATYPAIGAVGALGFLGALGSPPSGFAASPARRGRKRMERSVSTSTTASSQLSKSENTMGGEEEGGPAVIEEEREGVDEGILDEELDVREDLVEAIMKRPETIRSPSLTGSGSGSGAGSREGSRSASVGSSAGGFSKALAMSCLASSVSSLALAQPSAAAPLHITQMGLDELGIVPSGDPLNLEDGVEYGADEGLRGQEGREEEGADEDLDEGGVKGGATDEGFTFASLSELGNPQRRRWDRVASPAGTGLKLAEEGVVQ